MYSPPPSFSAEQFSSVSHTGSRPHQLWSASWCDFARNKRFTKSQIRSVILKEFFFETAERSEGFAKNLRDNKKERMDVNEEECQLRRGNREQNAANLHKESKVASQKKFF